MGEEAASLLNGSNNLRLTMAVKNVLGLLAVERGDYARARDLLEYARHHGFGRDEVIQIIQSLP